MANWLRGVAGRYEIIVSTQVLIKLRAVLTHKFKPAWSAEDAGAALEALTRFEVIATNANLVLDANALAHIRQLSWFDALIAEAAIRSHCEVLFSEDFSHGQHFDGLTVCNPFLTDESLTHPCKKF